MTPKHKQHREEWKPGGGRGCSSDSHSETHLICRRSIPKSSLKCRSFPALNLIGPGRETGISKGIRRLRAGYHKHFRLTKNIQLNMKTTNKFKSTGCQSLEKRSSSWLNLHKSLLCLEAYPRCS